MDTLPSSEFRKTFAKLTEITWVTVNGHPIGCWKPGPPTVMTPELLAKPGITIEQFNEIEHLKAELAKREPIVEALAGQSKDRIIGKVYWDADPKSAGHIERSFNSRPFTPAPKKGK